MKKLVAVVVCLFALAVTLLGTIGWTVAEQCYQPKLNPMVACLTSLPNNAVGDCGDITNQNECNGNIAGNLFVYEVENYPDGAIEASSGATHQVQRPCWRWHGCFWNAQAQPPRCENKVDWSAWRVGFKTEANPNVTCQSNPSE